MNHWGWTTWDEPLGMNFSYTRSIWYLFCQTSRWRQQRLLLLLIWYVWTSFHCWTKSTGIFVKFSCRFDTSSYRHLDIVPNFCAKMKCCPACNASIFLLLDRSAGIAEFSCQIPWVSFFSSPLRQICCRTKRRQAKFLVLPNRSAIFSIFFVQNQ